MKVEIEDVIFWMDAIRQSENYFGTLESFWRGQVYSKVWLIEHLQKYAHSEPANAVIHGGWNGVLASLMFNSQIPINHIDSIDIDPGCEEVANMINKRFEMESRFHAHTSDMAAWNYETEPEYVINTSTEHLTRDHYDLWLSRVPDSSLVILQSNNYTSLPEHVRCEVDADKFADFCGLNSIYCKETLELPLYNRFLVIGRK
jgi:hypothetical protein